MVAGKAERIFCTPELCVPCFRKRSAFPKHHCYNTINVFVIDIISRPINIFCAEMFRQHKRFGRILR